MGREDNQPDWDKIAEKLNNRGQTTIFEKNCGLSLVF